MAHVVGKVIDVDHISKCKRTRSLHGVLEVARGQGYDTAVLDRVRLIGADAGRAQGKISFQGMLALHGTAREVQGTADIARTVSAV